MLKRFWSVIKTKNVNPPPRVLCRWQKHSTGWVLKGRQRAEGQIPLRSHKRWGSPEEPERGTWVRRSQCSRYSSACPLFLPHYALLAEELFCSVHQYSRTSLKTAVWNTVRRNTPATKSRGSSRIMCECRPALASDPVFSRTTPKVHKMCFRSLSCCFSFAILRLSNVTDSTLFLLLLMPSCVSV